MIQRLAKLLELERDIPELWDPGMQRCRNDLWPSVLRLFCIHEMGGLVEENWPSVPERTKYTNPLRFHPSWIMLPSGFPIVAIA